MISRRALKTAATTLGVLVHEWCHHFGGDGRSHEDLVLHTISKIAVAAARQ